MYRGKQTNSFDSTYEQLAPIYSRRIAFIVNGNKALEAIRNVECDTTLNYSLFGNWTCIKENTYNCCTYANKILKDAGINTGFDKAWVIKRSNSLIALCESYGKEYPEQTLTEFKPYGSQLQNNYPEVKNYDSSETKTNIEFNDFAKDPILNNAILPTPASLDLAVGPPLTKEDLRILC